MDRAEVCRQPGRAMNEPNVPEKQKPEDGEKKPADGRQSEATAKALTPEQQMEAFAKELKEQDWGHQPC
jgi:hypothetical protein